MDNAVEVQELGKVMITPKGEYSLSKSYEILDAVSYNGSSYVSKINDNTSVPTSDDWQLLARKGDTYELSEEDLQRIAEQITSNANSAFNQNVKEKTDGFNSNANSKTEAYNTNATEKLGTYNSNHTARLKEYNDNATSKLSAYNTNTVTKTTEYNSNHTSKLNAYDTNASNKVGVYNTNADTRLEEYNTNADNKIAEYDEHSKELNNKIVSTRNELERLKSNVLNTCEDTDTFIHLEDSAMAELQEIKVDGVLSQETTNGYQLFDVSKVTTISNGTIENEIVTSNALNGERQGVKYNFPSITLDANTTYYIFADIRIKSGTGSVNGINNGVVGWKKVSFPSLSNNYNTFISKYTPTENENIYSVYLGFNNANNLIINIQNVMITTDRNATYEKYTGNQPSPNPDYPQEIKTITGSLKITSCGKNLFSSDSLSTWKASINRISKNEFELTSAGDYSNANISFMKLKKYLVDGQEYTLSANFDNPNGNHIGFNIINVSDKYTDDLNGTLSMSFTYNSLKMPSIYLYANASTDASITGTIKYYNVMLTNKSLSDNYEDYIESQIQAKLPENEFIGKLDDTYKDTLRTKYFPEEGQYHFMLDKKVGKYVFTGNENILLWQSANYIKQYYYILNTCLSTNNQNNIYAMSNYFKGVEWYNSWTKNNVITIGWDKKLFINSKDFTSINDLKNFLSTNAVEVYYPLETPYTIDLGVIDMPLSYNEVTNIFTDSDLLPTINAKYYRVFEKTIQNVQINDKTLKQEITDLNATVSALDNRLKALENKTTEEPTESEGTV